MTQLPKYMQQEVDSEEPRVLVEFQKHQTVYWNATGKERLLALALRVLEYRMSYNFFRTVEEIQKELDQHGEPVTKEELAKIPGKLLNEAHTIMKNHQAWWRDTTEELRHSLMAEKAIENNDGALAWLLLNERTGYEHERIELHVLL